MTPEAKILQFETSTITNPDHTPQRQLELIQLMARQLNILTEKSWKLEDRIKKLEAEKSSQ